MSSERLASASSSSASSSASSATSSVSGGRRGRQRRRRGGSGASSAHSSVAHSSSSMRLSQQQQSQSLAASASAAGANAAPSNSDRVVHIGDGAQAEPLLHISSEDVNCLELAGNGRFGAVYRAIWRGREVAVKKTLCFENEARLLASLSHKNIIKFHGACTTPPNFFLVTEFAEYGSLFKFLQDFTLETDRILSWATDIANGMDYLHNGAPERIIHRDLKSLNVLVMSDCSLKICDFGSSRAVGCQTVNLSTFAGTVAWMAPEVIRNDTVTEKCDVWSFGVILWELLTQEIPYDGMEPFAVTWLVASRGISLPLPNECPADFAELAMRCWSRTPSERPAFSAIVKKLRDMAEDEDMPGAMAEYMRYRGTWHQELEIMMQSYQQLEEDHERMLTRFAELDKREAMLSQREAALQHHIASQAFGGAAPVPVSPFRSPPLPGGSPFKPSPATLKTGHQKKMVKHWTEAEVLNWIHVLPELNVYEDEFRKHNINGKRLIKLTHGILKEDFGIKSFGHRDDLLEHIKRIQKSVEYPPLERSIEPLPPAADALERQLTLYIDVVAEHDPALHHVRVQVDASMDAEIPESLRASTFIKHVDFNITSFHSPTTNVYTKAEEPFFYSFPCDRGGQPTDMSVAVHYEAYFRKKKTTKINFKFQCGRPVPPSVHQTVQLTLKQSMIERFAELGLTATPLSSVASTSAGQVDGGAGGGGSGHSLLSPARPSRPVALQRLGDDDDFPSLSSTLAERR